MNKSLKIDELIAQIQHNARRRQHIENTYFAIPLHHIHQLETEVSQKSPEKVHTIDQLFSAGSLEEKIQSLSIHGAVKETAIRGSRNRFVRIYKKLLFILLKPLLTHQQEFNTITTEVLRHQLSISTQYGEIIKDSLMALTKYNVEILKGLTRATTLILNDLSQQVETTQKSLSEQIETLNKTIKSVDEKLAEEIRHLMEKYQSLIENLRQKEGHIERLRRRVRIGLIHLNNAIKSGDGRLSEEIRELVTNYQTLVEEIEEKGAHIDVLRRRLRVGLIHLNNSFKRDTQMNQAEIQKTNEHYRELSRRLSELSLDISEQLRDIVHLEKKGIEQHKKTKTAPCRSLYDDPLFFDLQKFEKYVRGEDELKHFQDYVDVFKSRKNVLDAGCGTGTFLQLLKDNGIGAYGVDIDPGCVKECKKKNLKAINADIVEHLRSLPDNTLDGFFAAQLIEHLEFEYLLEMLRQAFLKLSPGSPLVLETVNTTCLTIYSGSFYADPTHIRPVHPVTLKFVLQRIGYEDAEIRFINPFPDEERLQLISRLVADDTGNRNKLSKIARIIDENCQKLNAVLFSYKDYAIFAQKP
ncbi:methyltransferase domain-containing protein [Candidatus Sumerlaeota bacterium]|nr:methyltransferase domain-containing protein [Candidatus Sumerlaeota bacterium]